ncbi:sigma-70 family RNA polymerase sigma factor [Actinokineospora auranticolor]|uniref:RNA polymerase sigma factor n=1 Tax=Actinokineospora auranticolor TaxID=155976 RepID=A0A2S6GK58_9PSEU|nr:sigma-70 family RNA polymerase sigma factor [Actinokineospora auranticolor]PPK65624.1 RNA polymerase sigma-70 factor (ECF subfamily) [Actinokineospora auranticolor]
MVRLFASARTARADEALVRALHGEHGPSLLAYATRLTGDRAAAEDVVQEAFVRAWRNAGALAAAPDTVRAWLFTVARNLVVDRARALAARPAEVTELAPADPVLHDHAQRVVDSMSVLAAIDRLSADHRRVLVEIYFHDRSVADAARALGVAPGTVKSRSHYAVRALRAVLAGQPEWAAT